MSLADPTNSIPNPQSWRELYAVHPCADAFPMMDDAEIDELAEDIAKNGLQEPVVLWRADDDADGRRIAILDGRNRLEALFRLGVMWSPRSHGDAVFPDGHSERIVSWNHTKDPAAFVISANIRRRHLTKEQQAELIVRTLKAAQPNDSAKVARSFNPTKGKRGGSTKHPVLSAAIEEGKRHDISQRTIERATAKVAGRTPKSTIEEKVTRPAMPSTYEWVDRKLTELAEQQRGIVALYQELDATAPRLKPAERRTVCERLKALRKRIDTAIVHFGGQPKPLPESRA